MSGKSIPQFFAGFGIALLASGCVYPSPSQPSQQGTLYMPLVRAQIAPGELQPPRSFTPPFFSSDTKWHMEVRYDVPFDESASDEEIMERCVTELRELWQKDEERFRRNYQESSAKYGGIVQEDAAVVILRMSIGKNVRSHKFRCYGKVIPRSDLLNGEIPVATLLEGRDVFQYDQPIEFTPTESGEIVRTPGYQSYGGQVIWDYLKRNGRFPEL